MPEVGDPYLAAALPCQAVFHLPAPGPAQGSALCLFICRQSNTGGETSRDTALGQLTAAQGGGGQGSQRVPTRKGGTFPNTFNPKEPAPVTCSEPCVTPSLVVPHPQLSGAVLCMGLGIVGQRGWALFYLFYLYAAPFFSSEEQVSRVLGTGTCCLFMVQCPALGSCPC